jgi:hypothetical protein
MLISPLRHRKTSKAMEERLARLATRDSERTLCGEELNNKGGPSEDDFEELVAFQVSQAAVVRAKASRS